VALALADLRPHRPTVGFVGWFGPRGLASIVFAIIVVEGADLPHVGLLITVVVITVALSVLAHGLSAGPLCEAYAGWYAGRTAPGMRTTRTSREWCECCAPRASAANRR